MDKNKLNMFEKIQLKEFFMQSTTLTTSRCLDVSHYQGCVQGVVLGVKTTPILTFLIFKLHFFL